MTDRETEPWWRDVLVIAVGIAVGASAWLVLWASVLWAIGVIP